MDLQKQFCIQNKHITYSICINTQTLSISMLMGEKREGGKHDARHSFRTALLCLMCYEEHITQLGAKSLYLLSQGDLSYDAECCDCFCLSLLGLNRGCSLRQAL